MELKKRDTRDTDRHLSTYQSTMDMTANDRQERAEKFGHVTGIGHVTRHVTRSAEQNGNDNLSDKLEKSRSIEDEPSLRPNSVKLCRRELKTRSGKAELGKGQIDTLAWNQTPELEQVFRLIRDKKSCKKAEPEMININTREELKENKISKVRTLKEMFEKGNKMLSNSPKKPKSTIKLLNKSSCKKMKRKIDVRKSTPIKSRSDDASSQVKSSQMKLSDYWERMCSEIESNK